MRFEVNFAIVMDRILEVISPAGNIFLNTENCLDHSIDISFLSYERLVTLYSWEAEKFREVLRSRILMATFIGF